MGFLDNSGDIILDAVLTDAGRQRMARGDGSFRITKFALADDEIDYGLYNTDHVSGSAYYDLEILQTPVMEAFTNNTSMMKSKLVTITRTNLLYLPILKINEKKSDSKRHSVGTYVVCVDKDTEDLLYANNERGVMKGENGGGSFIRVDQGLDTQEISYTRALDAFLTENLYIIQIDNRLGRIASPNAFVDTRISFIDDDNIAHYNLTLGSATNFVSAINNTKEAAGTTETIAGPRGTRLEFQIRSSTELNTGTFFFDKLGTSDTAGTYNSKPGAGGTTATTVKYIDSTVKVIGGQTGYRIDVPVRFIKKD